MIRITDLEFSYPVGDFALRIEQLTIERGMTAAIVGSSGSGKTTLLNLMAGIMAPKRGKVAVNGVEVNALSETACRRFRIANAGLVFQEFELLEYLTVLDNILLPYRINKALTLDKAVRDRATGLGERVGVGDKLDRFVTRLSQGERQRVAVCRALLPKPSLLLADEPTGNLDPSNKTRVLDILFGYARDANATPVTVTHDHGLLDRFDRVIDIEDPTS